jgi:uncharacterized protein YqjF (DUF2071 family)
LKPTPISISPADILRLTDHRPWPLPKGNWRFYQEWNDAVFLHWKVDPEVLRTCVPEGLEIDLHDGTAWVSIVAFTMQRIRPKGLPAWAPLSNFHEVNVRTYVRHRDKAGVYFLSIEAGSRFACMLARTLSVLPYRPAPISRSEGVYRSSSAEGETIELRFHAGAAIAGKTDPDRWLTERYALFQDTAGSLMRYETHHAEWPLHACELIEWRREKPRWPGLLGAWPDALHYSPGVAVLAWDAQAC